MCKWPRENHAYIVMGNFDSLVNQAARRSNSPSTLSFLFHHFKHFSSPPEGKEGRENRMLNMMENENYNDKGELINRTAWFTRLPIFKAA